MPGAFPAILFLAVALSGCAVKDGVNASAVTLQGVSGVEHGGQQPIAGATVQLWAPGLTAYGSGPTLLTTTTSDAHGMFSLPAYTCPANAGLVYLTATGGDSGSGVNPLIAEAAVLGPCASLTSTTFINMSEVTTVAAAYALAPFSSVSSAGTGVGTSAGNTVGFQNVFNVTELIAPYATGFSRGATAVSGAYLPESELNTLADVIAACINTSGSTAVGSNCGTLISSTMINGIAPIDTFQAAINIARAPGANVGALFGLVGGTPPFQPTLSSIPHDFTMAIAYFGANINTTGTSSMAIDGSGNAWVLSGTDTISTIHDLTKISPAGTFVNVDIGASCGAAGLAIDPSDVVYVSCGSTNTVLKYNPGGALLGTLTATSLNSPSGMAFDAAGNLWVANSSASASGITEFGPTGVEATGSPFATGASNNFVAASPAAIWVQSSTSAQRVAATSHAIQNVSTTGSTSFSSVAVDSLSNAWLATNYLDQFFANQSGVSQISDAGALLSPTTGYLGTANVLQARGTAVDGSGMVYTSNSTQHQGSNHSGAIQVFTNAGTLASSSGGYYGPFSTFYFGPSNMSALPINPASGGLAVDASGNLWVAGAYGSSSSYSGIRDVAMIVGFGAPVVTPTAAAVATGRTGTRP
jgi:hypothetical protein